MDKIKEFQSNLKKQGIDIAILLNNNELIDNSFFYFTGLKTEYEILIIPKAGKPVIITSALEYERVKKTSRIKNLVKMGTRKEFEALMKKYLKKKIVGINETFLPIHTAKRLRKIGKPKSFKDISNILVDLRGKKTSQEEKILQKACDISKRIFQNTLDQFNQGRFRTEIDIKDYMESEMRRFNVTPSFPIIVASGKNASMPHHEPSSGRLNKGFCIIDFGVNYKGYCSDITRTIYFGTPTDKEIESYYELLGVQEEAIKDMQLGIDYVKVHKSVVKVLGDRFIHGLGHGLGIDVHEQLTSKKKLILEPGMYLTVEPGVYVAGKYGIRIEDDILITKSGPKIFSMIGKDLIIIK